MEMWERVARYVVIAGLFATLLLPLVAVNGTFFPFITGKNFLFRIIVEIVFAAWALLALRHAAYRPRFSWILGAFAAFIAVLGVSNFLGEDPYRSFWSNFERMEGYITHLHLFAYFLVLIGTLTTEKLWRRFFQFSLSVSMVVAGYGFLQMAGELAIHQGSTRVDASFGNAAYLAIYTLFHIFLAAFLWVRTRTGAWGWLYGATILANLTILYQTATRGTILGLLAGALLTALLVALFEKERPRVRKIAVGVLTAVVAMVGLFFIAKDTAFVRESPVLSRFASISLSEQTTRSRFQVWGLAIEGYKEHPILGWGQENFNLIFNMHYDPRLYDQEPFFDRAHNVFLDWLTAGGILGLLTYLAMFAAAVWHLYRVRVFGVLEKSILVGLLAGYFTHNFFVFDNLISYLLAFAVLAFIHSAATKFDAEERGLSGARRREDSRSLEESSRLDMLMADRANHMAAGAILLIALLFVLYIVNIKPILANTHLLRATVLSSRQDPMRVQEALALFKEAIAYDTFGTGEAREHLAQAATRIRRMDVADDIKTQYLNEAYDQMRAQIEAHPKDARYELFAAALLSAYARYDEAQIHFEQALEDSPRKQTILLGILETHLNKGDPEKAMEVGERTLALAPENLEAREAYALSAIYARDLEKAREILAPVYEGFLVPKDNFTRAFVTIGRFDIAAEIWEYRIAEAERLATDGNAPFTYYRALGATYAQMGRTREGIAQVERAIEVEPRYREEGEALIDQIRGL